MSVYRVISNYYNDLLDFLTEENIKNKGLENLFQSIKDEKKDEKKKQIITKLTEMMFRINNAFMNEILFWKNKEKEQTWFKIIYIIMLIIIFIIMLVFLSFRFKEIKERPEPDILEGIIPSSMVMFKSIVSFIIVYFIIFSIILVFLINISATKKLCTGQQDLLKQDFTKYTNYIFETSPRGNLGYFFTLFGYWRRNTNTDRANITDIKAILQKDSSYSSLLSKLSFTTDSKKPQATLENITGKEIEIYNDLEIDIKHGLINFFNKGYIRAKQILIESSPILMLKESKRIMNYYYLLSYKKQDEDPGKKQKQQNIITTVIVNPLADLFISADSDTATGELDNEAVSQSETDPVISKEISNILSAFVFLAYFVYPIYIKTSDKSNTFPQELLPFMPQNISIKNSTDKDIKNAFENVYNSDYTSILTSAISMNDPKPAIQEVMNKMIPLFTDLYYRLFLKLKGNIWFPFNKEYITTRLTQTFNTFIAATLPADYKIEFIDLAYEYVVTSISDNFDVLSLKRSDLIDNMSTALLSYKMTALPYQNYIINSIINKNPKTEKYIDELTEFLVELDNSIIIKKGLLIEATDIDQKKFMDSDEFIDVLKNLSYNNLQRGFEVDNFKTVINGFYMTISTSVNSEDNNLRNIYLQRSTSITLWETATTMVIILLILIVARLILSAMFDYKRIKKLQVNRNCDILFAERDYKSRWTNFIIKLILPIFFTTFIIAMIIAFRKKMSSTFEFNKEIIENNTLELRKSLDELSNKLNSFASDLNDSEKMLKFSIIDSSNKITDNDKKELFESVRNIVDKYEKCNYIIESAKTTIPFPYPEVIMNGFMLTVTLFAIFYALSTFAPIKRLRDIKKLNKLKAQVLITDDMQEINSELTSHSICHNEDMDSIVLALKMIFFSFIIMFLIFYSVKIVSTASDFQYGLYNSAFFEESRCYDT